MRRFAAAALSAALAFTGVLVFGALTTTAASAATCTGTVQITSMSFNPATVAPGRSSVVTLVAQNCTSQPIQASVMWYARFLGSTSGIPSGCVVYDPIVLQLSLPANGSGTSSMSYQVFANCQTTGLQAQASISVGGTTLASQSATLVVSSTSPSTSAAPTCAVSYARQSEWGGGFVAQLTITNIGTAPISGWTLAFTFPGDQHITSAWNATITQTGAAVSARSMTYNSAIAPGASTSLGFQGTWTANDSSPTAFTLNQLACTTR